MSRSGGEGIAREGKAESTGEAAARWTRAGLSPPLRLPRSLAGRREERPTGGTSSMKWGPRHLLRASQGIFQRNLKSWKEFENAALRNETGRQSELRDESQMHPWWEVCGRIPYIWFLVMRSSSGFSTVTRLPDL